MGENKNENRNENKNERVEAKNMKIRKYENENQKAIKIKRHLRNCKKHVAAAILSRHLADERQATF